MHLVDRAIIRAEGPNAKLVAALQSVIFHSSGEISIGAACAAAEAIAGLADEDSLEFWGVSALFKLCDDKALEGKK